jgi:hypothetical protein
MQRYLSHTLEPEHMAVLHRTDMAMCIVSYVCNVGNCILQFIGPRPSYAIQVPLLNSVPAFE